MRIKKGIIIYSIIVALVVIISIFYRYTYKNFNSILFVNHNSNYYYALSHKNLEETGDYRIKFFNLITYDKQTKKEKKYNFKNLGDTKDIVINPSNMQSSGDWIIFKSYSNEGLTGININNGDVKILVNNLVTEKGKIYSLKDFSVYKNNIIYSYVSNDTTYVETMNIKNNKRTVIAKFNNSADVPVAIYEDKAAYISDNKIYLYDLNNNKIIKKSTKNYSTEFLLYKDKIYTFKSTPNKNSLVSLDFNMKETEILKNINRKDKLYYDKDKIIFNNYFYDTNNNQLYIRKLNKTSYKPGRLILGDYIFDGNSKYEKLKENKNYIKASPENEIY
ncbi:hypothetical protein ACFO6R_10600 [Eubacterium multiforme]|uniref:DUF5050 domain-containing protein n=1 Tax=Eubacterium multiforme TaxID=83339 RepID=A0ABT9UY96_9FIRM|nr:hypothetical protein [Eubacterium multiforme]MDQ0151224.1 hypothetical protein [Eubacterium multiforme]